MGRRSIEVAVRTNIGKITAAIEQGRAAYREIDHGPIQNPNIGSFDNTMADWDKIDLDPTIFIQGPHQWGSNIYKVTK